MMTYVCVLGFFCILCVQVSHQKPERCNQAPEQGQCLARIPRLYYEAATNSCKEFFYGGCGGNENNFETTEDCDNVCVQESQTEASGDRCTLSPQVGNCKASLPRMYYNSDTNTCQTFTYGGCGGNSNNFETVDECQTACVKNLASGVARCFLKAETGVCRARIPRLFYDVESNTCKEFIYGGCGGNDNNFLSLEECDKTCVTMSRYGASHCYLSQDPGPCKQSVPRQYYDPSSNTCKEFNYGGCEGNGNNFYTVETCTKECIRSTSDNVCSLPAEKGSCRGMVYRYYYSTSTKKCGQFIYGGCEGNENNFETLDECEDACGNIAPILSVTQFHILIICLPIIMGKLWF